jgi:hypothetical protein
MLWCAAAHSAQISSRRSTACLAVPASCHDAPTTVPSRVAVAMIGVSFGRLDRSLGWREPASMGVTVRLLAGGGLGWVDAGSWAGCCSRSSWC